MQRNILSYLNHWIRSKSRKPLVLRGARQVGKSTAVRLFASQEHLTLYEINLERHPHLDAVFATLNMENIRTHLESILKRSIVEQNSLLFLDEVQATPHALAALRYFYEDWPQLSVIAAGSLLEFELAEHSYSMPVGRIQYCFLQPLSFGEFLSAKGEDWLREQIRSYRLGQPWPEATHEQLKQLLYQYLIIGGMPEVVAHHIEHPRGYEWREIQDNVIATYRDDFAKYGKKIQIPLLQQIYDRLPREIGHKIKASVLAPDYRAEQVRDCLHLLTKARLIRLAYHTHADGIPLAAQVEAKIFKAYWLDVGLLARMSGLSASFSSLAETQLFKGKLAEQFVAQHLADLSAAPDRQTLYYWLREGKTANAELDFLVQRDTDIIPIEVKSGKTGSLKSLLQFVAARNCSIAIKFSLNAPSVEQVEHEVVTPRGVVRVGFTCYHLPIYFAEELAQFLN